MINLSIIKQQPKKLTSPHTKSGFTTPQRSLGFTIVELLVVIVVIGILAAITIVSYTGISQRAIAASLQSDLANAKKQLQIYQAENDTYPEAVNDCPNLNPSKICLEGSGGNEFTNYSVNNSTNPPTFTLDVYKGDTTYRVTNDTAPVAVDDSATFVMAWGGASNDYGSSVVQTSDGGYAVSGHTRSYGAGNDDAFLAKYTADGTLSWSKTWGGTGHDVGNSIIQTSDGGLAVAGTTISYGAGDYDVFLAKYNSDGTITNCSSPMCQSPTSTVMTPTATVTTPSPTVGSPSPTVTTPSPTVTSPTPTTTVIVAL